MKLKFCGLTRALDYQKAGALGADFAGFIFHPASPRYVTPEIVKALGGDGPLAIPKVGVFVDGTLEEIKLAAQMAGLSVIQLHGPQTPEFAKALGMPFWKVIRLKTEADLAAYEDFATDTFLLDAFKAGVPGGTGKTIPLNLLNLAIQRGRDLGKKIWVAGGLNPDNLAEILSLNPWGVDVNSGVESEPGVKDHGLMERVAALLR